MNLNTVFQLALAAALPAVACANNITGPSSSQSPYVVRSQPGVDTVSLLTVGDAVNYKADGVTPYRMVGIPDGLGAFDNGDGTFTILMNQELGDTQGIVREHGFRGAFISKWTVGKENLEVLHGEDLIQQLWSWNAASNAYVPGPARTHGVLQSGHRIGLRRPHLHERRGVRHGRPGVRASHGWQQL
jgi:hypothetical protein